MNPIDIAKDFHEEGDALVRGVLAAAEIERRLNEFIQNTVPQLGPRHVYDEATWAAYQAELRTLHARHATAM